MIVVSDAGPVHYLILISQIELLPRLYRQVVVPVAVVNELQHIHTPLPIRTTNPIARSSNRLMAEDRYIQPPHGRLRPAPAIDGDEAGKYYGYFANQYGEQAVFVCDYQTGQASGRTGDSGWPEAHRVVDGQAEGVTLNESEAAWIRACWLAVAKHH